MREDELKTRIIYDQNNEPVEVAIPYQEFKAIEHLLEGSGPREPEPIRWVDMEPEIAELQKRTDRMGLMGLTEAIIEERERSR